MSFIRVQPRSTDPAALDALDATLRMCPAGGGHLLRHADGSVLQHSDGSVVVVATNERFMRYAMVAQGYVAKIFASGFEQEQT